MIVYILTSHNKLSKSGVYVTLLAQYIAMQTLPVENGCTDCVSRNLAFRGLSALVLRGKPSSVNSTLKFISWLIQSHFSNLAHL